LTGLASPFIGSMADRYGYRRIMRLALLSIVLGLLFVGSSQGIAIAIVGFVLMGFGFSGFVPTLHAYLSTKLPYRIRARGLGMLEYSWALAGILGLYTMGQLIALTNWRVPFFVMAGGLLLMWLLLGFLPAARPTDGHSTPETIGHESDKANADSPAMRIRTFFDVGSNARSAYSAVVANTLLFFAGMQLFIVHGAWLSREYGLGAVELGTVALILGCFDLSASVSVSLFTDRIGKLRSVTLGAAGVLLGYLVLPFLNFSVVSAVVGIALTRACFEFGIVSQISLMSEQAPEQRGKFLSLSAAFTLLGGTVANLTGPWLYTTQGVWGLSLSSIAAMVVALFLLLTQVREIIEES
ncbi:MAG: MFS transporter, partial [Caldilineaceae bacterium]|nr:MFS transporter [Caldilineaceae bacterium]